LVSQKAEYLLKLDMEFHNVSDLSELIVSTNTGVPIRLKDVATVEDGVKTTAR